MAKPLLKWVGGKTQIIDDVMSLFPTRMNNYHEPFLGGGSVLLELLTRQRNEDIKIDGKIYASDLNPNLIGLYKNVQTNHVELVNAIKELTSEPATEEYYYELRTRFNEVTNRESVECSAMFLYLNKSCFRGLYREGPRGFNVPYGHYKTLSIPSEDHIKQVSELIKDVTFTLQDFSESLKDVEVDDFVYLDPPYAPLNDKSFVKYNSDGFSKHSELFEVCSSLKCKFLLSNADVPMVRNRFPSDTYNTKIISCRRAINSKKPESRANEVLITNLV